MVYSETSRRCSARAIHPPDDISTPVNLKVIDWIALIDMKRRGQEIEKTFFNDNTIDRNAHVVRIRGAGGEYVDAEVIDELLTYDGKERGQDRDWVFFGNSTNPPIHVEYHDTKVYAVNGDGTKNKEVWVKVRRIDRAVFLDPKRRGQDIEIQLFWPDLEDPEWDYTNVHVDKSFDGTAINPPWRIDPFQNIIDISFGGLYCLVFHNGNEISAFRMKNLFAPSAAYHKALTWTGWGTGRLLACQMRLETDFVASYIPLKITEHTVVDGPSYYTIEKGDKYVMTTTSKEYSLKSFADGGILDNGHGTSFFPIFNGKLGSYWAAHADFTITVNLAKQTSISATPQPDPYNGSASTINDVGDRFYGPIAGDSIFGTLQSYWSLNGVSNPGQTGGTGQIGDLWAHRFSEINPEPGTQPRGFAAYYKAPLERHIVEIYATFTFYAYDFFGVPIYLEHRHGTETLQVPWAFYSKVGGLDKLDVQTKPLAINAEFDQELLPALSGYTSFLGTSYGAAGMLIQGAVYEFPFALSDSRRYMMKELGDGIKTPYGELVGEPGTFQPWLHLSNGDKLIQGFIFNDVQKLYVDDVEWTPPVAGVIQTILIDIPFNRIQELATSPPV